MRLRNMGERALPWRSAQVVFALHLQHIA